MSLRFFEIHWHAHPSYWWANPPDVEDWLALAQGSYRPRRTLLYRVQGGYLRGDVIQELVWSAKLTRILKELRATGYDNYHVRVLHKSRPISGYYGIAVRGRGGEFDARGSEATYVEHQLNSYKRIRMKENDWDGSDVFMVPGLGLSVFVVERIAVALKEIRLRNVSIKAAEECSLP